MSYTKREWATGNVVGAVDLNRIENGIEDAGSGEVLVVNSIYNSNTETYTLDKTWQEIYDAFPFVIEYYNEDGVEGKALFMRIDKDNSNSYYSVAGNQTYQASSASGYPTVLLFEPVEPGGGTIV